MAVNVQFDRNKLKAVILHVCRTVPGDKLGAVKLHKVLYCLDMIFFAQSGRAVTGAEYKKRPFGPTCVPLLPMLSEMEREGTLRVAESDYFGMRKKEFIALAEPDRGRLTSEELALLDEVADFVCHRNSAKSISEYSHQLPWEMAEFGDVIGYDTALMLFPTEPSVDARNLVQSEAETLESSRSYQNAVGHSTYRDFRGRVLAQIGGA